MGNDLVGFKFKGLIDYPDAWMKIKSVRWDDGAGFWMDAMIWRSEESFLAGEPAIQDSYDTEERIQVDESLMNALTAQFDVIMKAYIEAQQTT